MLQMQSLFKVLHSVKEIRDNVENCTGIPGITLSLENQNLITFENNFCYKYNLSFVPRCDFETSITINAYIHAEDDEMYLVFYVLIFAFYPKLNLGRITTQRRFGLSLDHTCDVYCLPRDMHFLTDETTVCQLKDIAIKVSKRNTKGATKL